ncbi:transcriptional repressor LexA [Proteinivorax hydrogeniformans]|uniref:LexA repressor n=1 Tax=Proteinivorax hydrogeniformans TaxID=1826727 RepID=A0AAU8HX76_9FIRM
MESLSARQKEIFEFIYKMVKEKGYPPSVREIGLAVGLKSSSTVHSHLAKLEQKGYIKKDATKPRAIEILASCATEEEDKVNVNFNPSFAPIVGDVTAGEPILAEERIEGYFPLPSNLSTDAESMFVLSVKGDSMINAGICDGDLVIVKHAQTATNGDIVVALIEDEATVKRFFKEKDCIRLQPENDFYDPILVKDPIILGKVAGLFRHF